MDVAPTWSSSAPSRVQVLTNPDLLHGIFKFIPFNEERDLARCATVCQSFHEPAIRVLWRYLDDLLPLWHLLAPPNTPFPPPSDDGGIGGHDPVLTYLQEISSAQVWLLDPMKWDRFLWHARHVRGIRYFPHLWQSVNDLNSLLVQTITHKNGGTTFLPLLRRLQWMGNLSADTVLEESDLILFFNPALRQAAFQFARSDEPAVIHLLSILRVSSPFLEQIAVDVGYELDAHPSVIREVVSFPQVRHVHVGQTNLEGFHALVMKPNLQSLDVDTVTGGTWAGLGNTSSVLDLCDLSIRGDASAIFRLFDHLRFHSLKNAKISLSADSGTLIPPTEVTAFLDRFCNAMSTTSLQALQFVLSPGDQSLPEYVRGDEPNLRDLLAPILRLHDLRSFFLDAIGAIAKADAPDFEAIARAWPKLENLSILSGLVLESRVPLSAVHHLYKHCQHLKVFSIPDLRFPVIGVDEIPAPLDRSPAPSHPLQHLAVGGQYVLESRAESLGPGLSNDGAEAVARYLLDLFPNLDARWYKRELRDSRPGRWGPLPSFMRFDDRWRRIIACICSICSARVKSLPQP